MEGEATGRVSLVTGAGSPSGIGFACARVLGREGAELAITSTTSRIEERASELRSLGYAAAGFVADLTDRAQAHRLVQDVVRRYGRIDILVNNAGIASVSDPTPTSPPFLEQEDTEWEHDLAVNLGTAYDVTKASLPGMAERGWGRVIMVSSVTGPLVSEPGTTGYSAAKAAMDGLMRGLAVEMAAAGVTVNSVAPGWIATASQSPEEASAGLHTPIGRSGTPDEVAEVVAFLASQRASYLIGQSVVVDGGNTIQEAKG